MGVLIDKTLLCNLQDGQKSMRELCPKFEKSFYKKALHYIKYMR